MGASNTTIGLPKSDLRRVTEAATLRREIGRRTDSASVKTGLALGIIAAAFLHMEQHTGGSGMTSMILPVVTGLVVTIGTTMIATRPISYIYEKLHGRELLRTGSRERN